MTSAKKMMTSSCIRGSNQFLLFISTYLPSFKSIPFPNHEILRGEETLPPPGIESPKFSSWYRVKAIWAKQDYFWNLARLLFLHYDPLASCQKSGKTNKPLLRKIFKSIFEPKNAPFRALRGKQDFFWKIQLGYFCCITTHYHHAKNPEKLISHFWEKYKSLFLAPQIPLLRQFGQNKINFEFRLGYFSCIMTHYHHAKNQEKLMNRFWEKYKSLFLGTKLPFFGQFGSNNTFFEKFD